MNASVRKPLSGNAHCSTYFDIEVAKGEKGCTLGTEAIVRRCRTVNPNLASFKITGCPSAGWFP